MVPGMVSRPYPIWPCLSPVATYTHKNTYGTGRTVSKKRPLWAFIWWNYLHFPFLADSSPNSPCQMPTTVVYLCFEIAWTTVALSLYVSRIRNGSFDCSALPFAVCDDHCNSLPCLTWVACEVCKVSIAGAAVKEYGWQQGNRMRKRTLEGKPWLGK